MVRTLLILLVTAGVLFSGDQILKARVPVLDLTKAAEPGAIRIGYTQRDAPRSPWLPTAVWVLILGRMLIRSRRASQAETIAFAAVLAGGLSTLYDRWRFGAVRAPFTILLGNQQALPFGINDLAITVGGMVLCVLLAQELVTRPRRRLRA